MLRQVVGAIVLWTVNVLWGLMVSGYLDFSFMYVLYSTQLHLPPLRFHCGGGRWVWTQDSRHWLSDALATRLHLIQNSATSCFFPMFLCYLILQHTQVMCMSMCIKVTNQIKHFLIFLLKDSKNRRRYWSALIDEILLWPHVCLIRNMVTGLYPHGSNETFSYISAKRLVDSRLLRKF
jgi:hypothetical protein